MKPAQAAAPFPRDADALFRAAAAALREGREAQTVAALQAGTRDHPGDARLWQLLGLALRNLEDLEPALAALDRARELAPADPLVAHTRARAMLEAGLPAAAAFEVARALAPGDGTVALGLAAALHAEGRGREAMALLDARLRQEPLWLAGHATLTRMRWAAGADKESAASFDEALRRLPREPSLHVAAINLWIEANRHAAALGAVARARAALGASATLDALEAICRSELGEIAAADRLFAGLAPPLRASVAVHEVRHLLRAGRPAEALRLAEPRIGLPGSEAFWPYLSLGWRLTGDPRAEWLEGDPRLIGVYDLADEAGPLGDLADRLRALHLSTHQPLEQSLRGGTQTDGPLFARLDPEIRRLRAAIARAVERHVAQLPAPDPVHPMLRQPRGVPVRFAGSWSVRLAGGGHHAEHVHPAGWISSAFYVSLPESLGGDGEAGWLVLGAARELGLELPPLRTVEPRPGRLVLFPSTMWHGTRTFPAGERLTVAFDVARPIQ